MSFENASHILKVFEPSIYDIPNTKTIQAEKLYFYKWRFKL
jgi:hypothetical protein